MLVGCSTPWIEGEYEGWRTLTAVLSSNGSGSVQADVRPESGETSAILTVKTTNPNQLSHLRYLQVDNRRVFESSVENRSDFSRSSAVFLSGVTTMNWPLETGELTGDKLTFVAGIVDEASVYTRGDAEVGVMLKADDDFSEGVLQVNVVFAGRVAVDTELSDAVEQGIDIWREVYAEIGIDLDIERFNAPDGLLQAPGQGDGAAYEAIAESTRFGAVNLVVLEEIQGFAGALGFAGNIPGPLVSSGQSAVAVNATLGAGTDGRYSPLEINLLAETMAHEVGHFLGLYHPVEASFDQWDDLDDTDICEREQSCLSALGTNLMFPYPVCTAVGCITQQTLTANQADLAHRYTGVR